MIISFEKKHYKFMSYDFEGFYKVVYNLINSRFLSIAYLQI